MDTEPLNRMSRAIADYIAHSPIRGHIMRHRLFRAICCVIECRSGLGSFGIDIVPEAADMVSVDLVPRKDARIRLHGAMVTSKIRLATGLSLNEAFLLIDETVAAIVSAAPVAAPVPTTPDKFRVGIITLPLSTNYGNNLQAFAMAETLRSMGHEPLLINRRRSSKDQAETDEDHAAAAARPAIADGIELEPQNMRNAEFINTHIGKVSSLFSSSRQLAENVGRLELDAIITGSDQVWRPRYTREMLPDFFLGFLPETSWVRRISYAASFGADRWEYRTSTAASVGKMLARFDGVSVREDVGVAMCRDHLGHDAVHVLDPTLLVPRNRYLDLFRGRFDTGSADRITTYLLDPADDKTVLLDRLSEALGLPVHDTSGLPYRGRNPLRGDGDKSIERWLCAVHESRYVVTDSFHGMVFAILFQRPFLAYANPGRGMARFTSMLKLVGLEDRLVLRAEDMTVEKALRPIDWSDVEGRLTDMRDVSMTFLRTALGGGAQGKAAQGGVPPVARPPALADSEAVREPLPERTKLGEVNDQARDGVARLAVSSNEPAVIPGAGKHPLRVQCTGCGMCISESRGSLAMAWSEDGFREPRAISAAVPPEALRVCPFNPQPEPEVADEDALGRLFFSGARQHHPDAGFYERAYIGYSTEFRPSSSSGGVATYVFDRLLRFGIVDHLFVVRGDAEGGYSYTLLEKADDIRSISKTRYYPVSMEKLFALIDELSGRVALSGVACFIKAVRLKQHYHPQLKAKIPFLIGIICGGLKSRNYTDFLASSAGAGDGWHDAEYRVKNPHSSASDYSFAARDAHGEQHHIRMKTLGDMWGSGLFKSKACDFCTDVLTELADLSLGDAWLPDYGRDGWGNSVMVTRSLAADALIQSGIDAGDLDAVERPVSLVVRSQQGGLDHKQKGVMFRCRMAAQATGVPIPHVRSRVQTHMSPGNMMVQILRERVRAKSLVYWDETRNAAPFIRRMAASRRLLAALTKVRKKNDRQIAELSRIALDHPDFLPETELMPVLVVLRWLRRKLRDGSVTKEWLAQLLAGRAVGPWAPGSGIVAERRPET